MVFRPAKLLSVLAVASVLAMPALAAGERPADFDAIRFTDDLWDPEIVAKLPSLQPKYISADHQFTIDPAPANDSEITKEDLATLHKYEQERRTPDQIALIKEEVDLWKDLKLDPSVPVSDEIRKKITALTAESSLEELYFAFVKKKEYNRARPTQLDPALTTVIPVPGHPSYPSAHGGQTHTVALVLGYIDPAHKDQYMQNANDIGVRREIAGVHYPSDTRAGIQLGTQVFDEMMKNHDFKTRIDELAEVVRTSTTN